MSHVERPARLLDPGMCLTLRPMAYPVFYEMYRSAIKNTWTVEEVNFSTDVSDLRGKMSAAERHLVERLVAFFATGDSIVSNNLVLNLYKHINAPEARMYLSRQLYEEALHVQFYLTLLDTYVPEPDERFRAFAAVESIPSIRKKAEFCFKWIDSIRLVEKLDSHEARKRFLLNLICSEEPELFDGALEAEVLRMMEEAIDCETQFAEDLLGGGIAGLSVKDVRQYLEFVADQRLRTLGIAKRYGARNPFAFMDLQDVQELANFFERRVSAYQLGVTGEVSFDAAF